MKAKLIVFVSILLSGWLITGLPSPALGCTRSDFESVIETSQQVIYIRPDGIFDPSTAPIRRDGDRYTFTGNIDAQIVVDKDNIVIDGAGFTLSGTYNGTQTDLWIIGEGTNDTPGNGTQVPWTVGIDMRANTRGVTIRNLNIKNFSIGIWLWTTGNSIAGNVLTENLVGILLSGINNSITGNSISKNRDGIFFGANQPGDIPSNITLSRNGFVDNARHLSGCVCEDFNNTETAHTWDDGQIGNYWSDYMGTDTNDNGIGDTPYIVDSLNLDRYPLMENAAVMPAVNLQLPVDLILGAVVLVVIAVAAVLKRPRKAS